VLIAEDDPRPIRVALCDRVAVLAHEQMFPSASDGERAETSGGTDGARCWRSPR
jgi:hypothetical protein